MAEIAISAPVGVPPSSNLDVDVRIVQDLLTKVIPPLSAKVVINGKADKVTIAGIREFQKRFMSNPDGIVSPDGRTIWHLNDGFASKYIGCSATKRKTIDRDMINAQKYLDIVNRKLATRTDSDTARKLSNIFHVDTSTAPGQARLHLLKTRFQSLRGAFDKPFPLICESGTSVYGAWVDLNDPDGAMHFPENHFWATDAERASRMVHERAHTIFQIGHDGMTHQAGEIDFGANADDDNGFTWEQAYRNAYCYGWLTQALQPDYVPGGGGEVITVGP